jgi:hypothetical protein
MRTNVYVDGFNLYYRAVRDTPYKWLDISAMCHALLPSHIINRIRYFTADVQARPGDPDVPARQQTYLRALRTIPNLSIHKGQFKQREIERPLVQPIPGYPRTVLVYHMEEKGSDVNLATFLLTDGYENDYEQALVVSNDSDLAWPITMVREKLSKPVGIVNPNTRQSEPAPVELRKAATYLRQLRTGTLQRCQFPSVLQDEKGTVTRPATW